MALDSAANFVEVIVSTGYNSSATSVVLSTTLAPTLPTPPYNMVWWDQTDYPNPTLDPNVEIVRVSSSTTVSGTTTLTVVRAQESTAATNKNLAGKTYYMIAPLTAKVINTDLPNTFVGVGSTMGASGVGWLPYVSSSNTLSVNTNTGVQIVSNGVMVAGGFILTEKTVTCTNGTNNNINVAGAGFIILSGPTAGYTVSGMTAGTNGQYLFVQDGAGQLITFLNASSSSSSGNRFFIPGGANFSTTHVNGFVQFVYWNGNWDLIIP